MPRRIVNGIFYAVALVLAFAHAWLPMGDPLVHLMYARSIPVDTFRPLYLAASRLGYELFPYLIACAIVWWLASAKNSRWRYGAAALGAAAAFVQVFAVLAFLPRGATPLKEVWLTVMTAAWVPVLPVLLTVLIMIVATRPVASVTPVRGWLA